MRSSYYFHLFTVLVPITLIHLFPMIPGSRIYWVFRSILVWVGSEITMIVFCIFYGDFCFSNPLASFSIFQLAYRGDRS